MTGSTRKCVNKSSSAELTGCSIPVKCSPSSSSVSACAPGKLLFQSNFGSPHGSGSLWLGDPTSQLAHLSIDACSWIRSPDSCCAANRGIWIDRFPLCLFSCNPSTHLFTRPCSAFQLIMPEVESHCYLCQESYVFDPVWRCVCWIVSRISQQLVNRV